MAKKLQVKTAAGWEFVFCRGHNVHTGEISVVTTGDSFMAISADGIEYFCRHFPNHEFRAEV